MARPTAAQVQAVLTKAITVEGTEWGNIVAAVRAELEIKNWLTQVRGPLQGMLNAGLIRRENDVHNEIYKAVA
jgi:hypothetical protein